MSVMVILLGYQVLLLFGPLIGIAYLLLELEMMISLLGPFSVGLLVKIVHFFGGVLHWPLGVCDLGVWWSFLS